MIYKNFGYSKFHNVNTEKEVLKMKMSTYDKCLVNLVLSL